MILELLSNPLTWSMAFFVIACTYFNQRSGYKQGVAAGMESTLKLLEDGGYITVEETSNGDAEIKKVPD
jgi:hypothetical protein